MYGHRAKSEYLSDRIANPFATDFGITGTGVVGIWTLNGTSETINLIAGPPVPGPLPLLGGGAAFAWSRRLRGRVKDRPMVEVDPGTHVQAD